MIVRHGNLGNHHNLGNHRNHGNHGIHGNHNNHDKTIFLTQAMQCCNVNIAQGQAE